MDGIHSLYGWTSSRNTDHTERRLQQTSTEQEKVHSPVSCSQKFLECKGRREQAKTQPNLSPHVFCFLFLDSSPESGGGRNNVFHTPSAPIFMGHAMSAPSQDFLGMRMYTSSCSVLKVQGAGTQVKYEKAPRRNGYLLAEMRERTACF